MPTRPCTLIALTSVLTHAAASTRPFDIDTDASSSDGSLALNADTDGTLIGDYDGTDNPEGTQTRPGLFGGSGNNTIPVTIDIAAETPLETSPQGAFSLNADTENNTFTVEGLDLDLIGQDPIASTIGLTLEYNTFRTINPNSLYPGGIPLPIEFEAGELTTLTAGQNAPMTTPGALVPTDTEGVYNLIGAVPVLITVEASALGGTAISPDPYEGTLPFAGTYTDNPDGSATISLTFELENFSREIDTAQAPPLPGIPLELPTLGTETAGVILSLELTELAVSGSGAYTIIAAAPPEGCNAADIAEPYSVLDLADISAFVTSFNDQTGQADLNSDGIYDLADITLFIETFTAGCP